jgi:hypothetical protein
MPDDFTHNFNALFFSVAKNTLLAMWLAIRELNCLFWDERQKLSKPNHCPPQSCTHALWFAPSQLHTCQRCKCIVLKNFMREGNFRRLVSTRVHPGGKFWNLSSPDRQKIAFPRFFFHLFRSTNLMCSCYKNMTC